MPSDGGDRTESWRGDQQLSETIRCAVDLDSGEPDVVDESVERVDLVESKGCVAAGSEVDAARVARVDPHEDAGRQHEEVHAVRVVRLGDLVEDDGDAIGCLARRGTARRRGSAGGRALPRVAASGGVRGRAPPVVAVPPAQPAGPSLTGRPVSIAGSALRYGGQEHGSRPRIQDGRSGQPPRSPGRGEARPSNAGLASNSSPAGKCLEGAAVSATATRSGTGTTGVLAATCLSTLVVNANTSAVSILLPSISDDTGMSVETLQWAVTGYSLVGAAVIVTSGSLGDVFGRKRVFQLGLLLFVVSCVLIALSTTGGMVIAGRLIQGAAGRHDPGLRAEPALGGEQRRGTAPSRLAVGSGRRGGRGSRTAARRPARRHHRVAGPVLGRRRRRGAVHGADVRDGDRVERPGPAAVDRLRRHRARRAHPRGLHPRR